jgi:xanthine dehydrogenase accessory factor
VAQQVQAEAVYGVATLIKGPIEPLGASLVLNEAGEVVHGELPAALARAGSEAARAALATGNSQRIAIGEGAELFIEVAWPAPTLVVVGGVHTAIPLTQLARGIGYRTIVVDPRKAFGNLERFPHVDQLITEWPDDALTALGLTRATALAMLTHDPKLDDPALLVALRSPAFYVGALGSRGTQEKRRARLREAGLSDDQLARLRGPIGLDLGGRTPEEVAVSILAEIVAARNGKTGRSP